MGTLYQPQQDPEQERGGRWPPWEGGCVGLQCHKQESKDLVRGTTKTQEREVLWVAVMKAFKILYSLGTSRWLNPSVKSVSVFGMGPLYYLNQQIIKQNIILKLYHITHRASGEKRIVSLIVFKACINLVESYLKSINHLIACLSLKLMDIFQHLVM